MRSVASKFFVPLSAIGILASLVVLFAMLFMKDSNVELAGIKAGESLASQIVAVRGFYTKQVVSRAKEMKVRLNYDFAERRDTLPLPATLVHHLGDQIAKSYPGMKVRLFSRYPFPHRAAGEKYDAFEKKAMNQLEKDPETPVWIFESNEKGDFFRYAVADLMLPGCVKCHNSHPETPKDDWEVGDVRGIIEVQVPMDSLTSKITTDTMLLILLLVGMIVLMMGLIWFLLRRHVLAPVGQVVTAVETMADGHVQTRVDLGASEDEISQIGQGINHMAQRLTRTLQNVTLQSKTIGSVVTEQVSLKKQLLDGAQKSTDLAQKVASENGRVDTEVRQLNDQIARVSEDIRVVSHESHGLSEQVTSIAESVKSANHNVTSMAAAAEQMSANLDSVNGNLSQVNDSVTRVRQTTEQVTESLQDVRGRCRQADERSLEATQTIERTQSIMTDLAKSSQSIEQVIEVINSMAEQTNMLALNASIEAAGAGEAGKGFAVVANEVKDLASQTAKAADEIETKVHELQDQSRHAASAAQEASKLIVGIKSANGEISEAVEGQVYAIEEITEAIRAMHGAASDVTHNAGELGQAAQEVARAASEAASDTTAIADSADTMADLARSSADRSTQSADQAEGMREVSQRIFSASAEVQKMSVESQDIAAALQGSISFSGFLTEVVHDTSSALKQAEEGLDIGQAPFDIGQLKQHHMHLRGKLEGLLTGFCSMTEAELGTAQGDLFGRWYHQDGQQRYGNDPRFAELGQLHQKIHGNMVNLLKMLENDQKPEHVNLNQCDSLRKQLFDLLDQLYIE
ncbi:methyl-accepting chemotaxis protein [Magnetococcus sp. PR-3]|uniref:methyl-accepting chemotaxis protein n=1 Tax=Magnetococcus sp. PR-3 TaxID=3120355 RepID=UPI002FCE2F0E